MTIELFNVKTSHTYNPVLILDVVKSYHFFCYQGKPESGKKINTGLFQQSMPRIIIKQFSTQNIKIRSG